MPVIAHGPTNEWAWPLPLYEHGGGRELSSKQWDDYKVPVIEVVPAEQLRRAVELANEAQRIVALTAEQGVVTHYELQGLRDALARFPVMGR